MPIKKGGTLNKKGAGRPKGSPNITTAIIREMAMASLQEVGGKGYFVKQAHENPNAYMAFISKILPKEIEAKVDMVADVTAKVHIAPALTPEQWVKAYGGRE